MEEYRINIKEVDLILAIPLHPARLRERGFNQSQYLAELLSQKYRIPLSLGNLIRTQNTKNQALLGQKERFTNIQGAFRIKHSPAVKNKSILIVDDLMTTGATVSEAALTLKDAGCGRVIVLTLAITP